MAYLRKRKLQKMASRSTKAKKNYTKRERRRVKNGVSFLQETRLTYAKRPNSRQRRDHFLQRTLFTRLPASSEHVTRS